MSTSAPPPVEPPPAGVDPTDAAASITGDAEPDEFTDRAWDEQGRHETPLQRLDRNWSDIMTELRVVQTGVQLLTGFLLTLPFQTRFDAVDQFGRVVYLVTVGLSVAATGFLIAPVSLHRVLFRRHARRAMVGTAHRLTLIGLGLLAAAVVGVALLIFGTLLGRAAGLIAAGLAAALLLGLWAVLPWRARRASIR